MAVQLPGDLKDGELEGDPKPIEALPSIAAEAPTLVAAGISEEQLHEDLRPYEPEVPPTVVVPDHHIKMAYDCLVRGQSAADAAKVASIPIEVAQKLHGEVAAVRTKDAELAPVKKGGEPIAIDPGPVEPIEEPIK